MFLLSSRHSKRKGLLFSASIWLRNRSPYQVPVKLEHLLYLSCKVLHFRPYLPQCLYCDVDFDVIGKLEDFNEDVAYIATKLNLTEQLGLLNYIQHKTPGNGDKSRRERRDYYMSKLSTQMVQDLYELYKIDFEMFSYDLY